MRLRPVESDQLSPPEYSLLPPELIVRRRTGIARPITYQLDGLGWAELTAVIALHVDTKRDEMIR